MSTRSASFAEFDRRARAGEALNVVFLGGSLTWGAGATDPLKTSYRARVGRRLREFYDNPRIECHDAAIGGTGSQLGIFRLERDVFRHEPDLIFVEFAVNDHPFAVHPGRLAAYEAIVRKFVLAGIPTVQGILAVKQDLAPDPVEKRPLDPEHRKISAAYHTGLGDAVGLMRAKVAAGETTPDQLWRPADGTHPNDAGYALYAEAMWNGFRQAVEEKRVCRAPEKMLQPDTFMTVTRQKISALQPLPAGWHAGEAIPWGCAFDFYMTRWFDDVTIAGAGAAPLRLAVNGSFIQIFGEGTKKSGKFQVKIDGEVVAGEGAKDGLYDANIDGCHLVRVLAENLDPARPHLLEIIPQLTDGQDLRLESVCVAGGAATVAIAS
jgi:lysophospholipase L1-like esterase